MITFLSVVVALPIAALIWFSAGNGFDAFWTVASSPQAVAALKLSLVMSALAATGRAMPKSTR